MLSPLLIHLRRVAIVLTVLFVVYLPSVCFGQSDDAGADLLMRAIAAWSENPGSPMALGAAIVFVVWLAVDAPYTSKVLGKYLDTPARKRAFAVAVSFAPALALALMQHMTWNAAARTALLSFAVSQAIKFLAKPSAGDAGASVPPAILCLAFLSAGQAACSPKDIEKLQTAAEAARDVAVVAEPCFIDARDRMLFACSGDAKCEAEVRRGYEPIADAFDAFHSAWCAISPSSEGCQ